MTMEVEVFTDFFEDLVAAVGSNTLAISNACLSQKLITRCIHGRILEPSGSSEQKATILLRALSDSMGHQKETGFNKFLTILKNEQVYDDLIERLEEARDRKHTAECTDELDSSKLDKQSLVLPNPTFYRTTASRAKLLRKKAVKKHLTSLSSQVQGVVAAVASTSLTKHLISKKTYDRAMRTDKTSEERTRHLLLSVCKCVRTDINKFNKFLDILNSHRSCQEVVQRIIKDIQQMKETAAASVKEQHDHTTQQLQMEATQAQPSIFGVDEYSKSKILLSSGKTSDVKVWNVEVDPRVEYEHSLRMDKKQDEALLLDSERQKKEFIEQRERKVRCLSHKIDQLEQDMLDKDKEISKLKQDVLKKNQELLKREKEIQALEEERDNFQLATDRMKVKVSLVEKEQCTISVLEKRVTDLEKKIVKQSGEINTLQSCLSCKNQEIRDRETSLNENRTQLEATQHLVKALKAELDKSLKAELDKSLKAELDIRDRKYYYCIILILLLFGVGVIVFTVMSHH